MTLLRSIDTSICTIGLREDGIYEYRFIDEYVVDREQMDEMSQALVKLVGEEKGIRLVSVPGRYGSIAPEAKTYDPLDAYENLISHIALVLPSLHQKILARAYFKLIKKPPYNYKFFKDEDSAVGWLRELETVSLEH